MMASVSLNLGFLTVVQETNGYVGGYLVTNAWGRPLEFRLSTAVQATRVQQILYGSTLEPYICAEVIGKALVDKTAIAVQLILTDREPMLELRSVVSTPVAWIMSAEQPQTGARQANYHEENAGLNGASSCSKVQPGAPLVCHPLFPEDEPPVRRILDGTYGHLDLAEPFARIREAVAEARKMGVTTRS
jgi:hypothetical protein